MYDLANSGWWSFTAIFNAFVAIAGGADWGYTAVGRPPATSPRDCAIIVGTRCLAARPTGARPRSGCWRWPRLAALTTLALAPVAAQGDAAG